MWIYLGIKLLDKNIRQVETHKNKSLLNPLLKRLVLDLWLLTRDFYKLSENIHENLRLKQSETDL
jgi:hypothetical protein